MRHAVLLSAATLMILGGTMAAGNLSERRRPDALAQPLQSIPASLGGWSSVENPPLAPQESEKLLATSYLSRTYWRAGQKLNLFIAYYDQQRSGESMHSPKHCLPGSGWEIWNIDSARIPVAGEPVNVNKYSIQHGADRAVVFYWYQSRRRIIASEYLGKVLLVRDALFDGRTSGSIVRITVPDSPELSMEAVKFASLVVPEVQRVFGK